MQPADNGTSRRVLSIGFSVLILGLVAPAVTQAEEGRVPIFERTVLDGSLGDFTGHYVVTRNITVTTGQPVIEVIGATGEEQIDIDVEDVTVKDVWFGIRVETSELFRIRGCLVNRADILAISVVDSGIGTIENNLMTNTDSISLLVTDYESVTVAGNKVLSGNRGIAVSNSIAGTRAGATIVNNTVRGTNQNQFAIEVLRADGSTIADNFVQDNVGAGIQLRESSGCLVEGNVSRLNGALGISLDANSNGNLVQRNVVSGNGSSGVWVQGDRNQIRNNTLAENASAGLLFLGIADDNTFGGNASRGNLGAPGCTVPPIGACASTDYCDNGTGNTSFGTNLMPGGC